VCFATSPQPRRPFRGQTRLDWARGSQSSGLADRAGAGSEPSWGWSPRAASISRALGLNPNPCQARCMSDGARQGLERSCDRAGPAFGGTALLQVTIQVGDAHRQSCTLPALHQKCHDQGLLLLPPGALPCLGKPRLLGQEGPGEASCSAAPSAAGFGDPAGRSRRFVPPKPPADIAGGKGGSWLSEAV